MNKLTKTLVWLATGIGLVSLVVLIVMQVKEPSQAQVGNDGDAAKTHDQSNKLDPQVRLEGVAGFDLKGIILGENITTIKKKFSCTGEEYWSRGTPSWGGKITCNGALIIYDHNGTVQKVMIYKEFSIKPDFQKMFNQVYKKYGEPDLTGSERNNAMGLAFISTNCWGSCKSTDQNTDYSSGNRVDFLTGKGLKMEYYNADSRDRYYFSLTLEDLSLGKKQDEWMNQEIKREQEKRKERESNLSL